MSSGLCLKFAFDTYEQEIERFGGTAGMAAAEAVFFADSRGAVGLLRCLRSRVWPYDEISLMAVSIDGLLGTLGFDESARLAWYEKQTTPGGQDIGLDYRQRKTLLRPLLGQTEQFLKSQPGVAEIASVLTARQQALAPIARQLQELAKRHCLAQSIDILTGSFVHLHLNRMGRLDMHSEQRVLSLLLRARESLKKAPIRDVASL